MTQAAGHTDFAPAERAPFTVLRSQHQAIADTRCRAFFDALPNLVLFLNRHRQVIFANQATMGLLGLSGVEEILGQRPGEALSCVNADAHPAGCGASRLSSCGAVEAILSAVSGEPSEHECRVWRRVAAGIEALDLKVNTTPITVDGQLFVVMALADITSENRRKCMERIFFHDVLNLAGGISGMVEMFKDEAPKDFAREMAMLHTATETLVDEVQAQREITAAENNELSVLLGPLDAAALLDRVRWVYARGHLSSGQAIVSEPVAQSGEVVSDARLVQRILGNMLKNALEAGVAGDEVRLRYCEDGADVVFSVHNQAVIPQDVQDSLFRRTFSTKGQGRGLGTYSMQLLAERYLSGSVAFSSSQGQGTTFFLRLPKHPGPDRALNQPPKEP